MGSDRNIARQILYILKGLRPGELRLAKIEVIRENGLVVGCKVEIRAKKQTDLKVISGGKEKISS